MPRLVFLWTDVVLMAMALGLACYAWSVRGDPDRRATWAKVAADPAALAAGVLLAAFTLVAALDSVHFRRALVPSAGAAADAPRQYAPVTESLLDALLARQVSSREIGYSEPLAWRGFTKVPIERGGAVAREFPRLEFAGAHLADPARDHAADVARRTVLGAFGGLVAAALVFALAALALARAHGGFARAARDLAADRTDKPWRAALWMVLVLCLVVGPIVALAGGYHVLGTDRTGNDVLYQSLKSVRTAFVIGILATVATLPFAVVLGVMAGYFRGWVDEVIQYLYTTLSSVPNVLLIAACVLMVQVFLDQHAELFETGSERSDLKILLLCVILGVTGWAQLCRLIRGETLKLRELEFVQAAEAFGVGPARIMGRHILPNVMHLVLITTVLNFSELILYEAVLTYVGVGVDPTMNSFGGMINLARSQMSGDPVVWWSFVSAFVFMVALVLAANLFADGVRDAFDPRARVFRPRLRRAAMS